MEIARRADQAVIVVLLPNDDDAAIEVTADAGQVILDRPFEGTAGGPGALASKRAFDPTDTRRALRTALAAAPPAQRSYLVFFETGGDTLTEASLENLARALDDVQRTEAARITVFGHTDRVGPARLNVRLARVRAERVQALLVDRGVAPDIINADSFGESFPLIPTADNVPEARNRRVEIVVR